jgi:hypothetical protein
MSTHRRGRLGTAGGGNLPDMPLKRKRAPRKRKAGARVCPNCAFISDEPLECCPRCGARLSVGRDENVADKASADSFPASDPPQH